MVEYRHTRKGTKPPYSNPGNCCWCNTPVEGRRKRWCSDLCVAQYKATTPDGLRRECLKRDLGVCAICARACLGLTWTQKLELGISRNRRDAWDADHIIPLIEGGTNWMNNIRTLCLPCHKAQTKTLAGRRKKKKGPHEHH